MFSAFSWLTASHLSSERGRAPPGGAASLPRASRKKTPFTGSTSKRCFFALLLAMWLEFQQLSSVPLDYCHAAGTVTPPGENGFITFRRFIDRLLCPLRPPHVPELTATIAWWLTPNNRAGRQTRGALYRGRPQAFMSL